MKQDVPNGKLVVLNGASSAGKTTVAEALRPLFGSSCVLTGFDEILDRTLPFGPESRSGLDRLRRSARIAAFQLTNGRMRLFLALHREVSALVREGHDVVVDTALMERGILLDAARCFAPLDGLFVGMKPPLAVSQRWEAARTDRPRGQARRHYDAIHAHGTYDLLLDPSTMLPQECAQAIMQRLEAGPPPKAFRQVLTGAR